MTSAAIQSRDLYFAILDRPVSKGRDRREELRHAFEPTVPGGLAGVHETYTDLPSGHVLAIGLPIEVVAELPDDHTAAHPASWPSEIEATLRDLPPGGINLLRGTAEPSRVKQARTRLWLHAAVGCTVLALLAAVWFSQVRSDHRSATVEISARTQTVYREALGSRSAGSRQPLSGLMVSELRRLRATRSTNLGPLNPGASNRADSLLASLLAAWPEDAMAKTESISVAPRSAEVVAGVPDLDKAQMLIDALGSVSGLEPGSVSTDRDRNQVRVSLRFNRPEAP